jgi:hypothetical protein
MRCQTVGFGWKKGVRRTFPRASRAPSKKSSTPSMMNIPPNEVKATPISVTGFGEEISYPSSVPDKGVWTDSERP